jgi:hypothetical protein
MFDWLGSNWQFVVGTMLGVAGILVGVWFAKSPSTLDYRVLLIAPLLSRHASKVPITVSHEGNELEEPYIVQLRVTNTGKRAVRADDYEEPITVRLKGPDLVAPFVAGSNVENLVPPNPQDVSFEKNEVAFAYRPALMNARDWFEIQMLCDGRPEGVRVTARYADQSRPVANTVTRQGARLFRLLLGADAFFLLLTAFFFWAAEDPAMAFLPGFLLVGSTGLTLGFYARSRGELDPWSPYADGPRL